ncbi:MAG: MFS transporter [Melioribacteraceae bacterium]|nr:MFS transporter [Melioribacteraceae bacterium]
MDYIRFFLGNKRLISFGFILTFFSSFGQTFLLSLYVPKIINEFQLTNSYFGGLYAIATVGSSFILAYVGKLIDKTDLRKYTLYSALLLLLACLIMAFSFNIVMIFFGLLGLRFAGQGLLSHISNTSISKFFDKTRGKALSITSLGYSTGEGVFPVIMSFVIIYAGWRNSLIINSAVVAFVLIPFIWFALSKQTDNQPKNTEEKSDLNFSRKELFSDKNFYLIAANSIVLPFLVTGLFFYQSSLAQFKGWTLEWLSFSFIGFAVGRTIFSLISGKFIDKYSAIKLLPFYLIPFFVGLLALFFVDHIYAALVYLTLTGVSIGLSGTIKAAVIAEIYGTNNLGGIRSIFATIAILGTALSPFLFGWLIDNGYNFSHIILLGLVISVIVAVLSTQIAEQNKLALQTNS